MAFAAKKLRVLSENPELESLRMIVDRGDELTRQRVQTVNRLHRLLGKLIPGTSKKDITVLTVLAEVGDVTGFADRNRFASWNWNCSAGGFFG